MFKMRKIVLLTFSLNLVIFLFGFYSIINSLSVNHLPRTIAALDSPRIYSGKKKDIRLMVLVPTYVKGKAERDAIRETWMKKYRENVSLVFLRFSIGTGGLSSQDIKSLTLEDTIYNDLLLLPHLYDSYINLTRKLLQSFVAIDKDYNFTYLVKCDDDTFVNMDTILSELQHRKSNQLYYWGYHFKKAKVLKAGKWSEKKWTMCDTYLPYASGGGYVLSKELVTKIAANADDLVLYKNDDVSVGLWLSPFNIDRHHDARFNTYPNSAECYESQIMMAERKVYDMIAMQRSLDNGKGLCP